MIIGEYLLKAAGEGPVDSINPMKALGKASTGLSVIKNILKPINLVKSTIKGVPPITLPGIKNIGTSFDIKPMKVAEDESSYHNKRNSLERDIVRSGFNPLGYNNIGHLVNNGEVSPDRAALLNRVHHHTSDIKSKKMFSNNALRSSLTQALSVMLKKSPTSSLYGSIGSELYNNIENNLNTKHDSSSLNEAIEKTLRDPHSSVLGKYKLYEDLSKSSNPEYKDIDHPYYKGLLDNRKNKAESLFNEYLGTKEDDSSKKELMDYLHDEHGGDKVKFLLNSDNDDIFNLNSANDFNKSHDDISNYIESKRLKNKFGISKEMYDKFDNINKNNGSYRVKKMFVPESVGQIAGGMAGYGLTRGIASMLSKDPLINNNRFLLGAGSGFGGLLGRTWTSKINDKMDSNNNRNIISSQQ